MQCEANSAFEKYLIRITSWPKNGNSLLKWTNASRKFVFMIFFLNKFLDRRRSRVIRAAHDESTGGQ